ncbi:MAG: hypothetical protein V3575_01325 [Candidatus Absconditabacteria bacterium]
MSVIPALFEYYDEIDYKNILSNIEYFFTNLEGDSYNILLNYSLDNSKWNIILALKSCYIEQLPSKQSQKIVFSKYSVDVNNIPKEYLSLFDNIFISNIFAFANSGDLSNLDLLLYKYEEYIISSTKKGFIKKLAYIMNMTDKSTKIYLDYLKKISTNYINGIIQNISNQELLNIFNQIKEYKFVFNQEDFSLFFLESKIRYLKLLIIKEIYSCIFEYKNTNSQYLDYSKIQDSLVSKIQKIHEDKYGLPSMLDSNDNVGEYNLNINETIADYKDRVSNIQDLIKSAGLVDLNTKIIEIISIIDILELIILNGMYNNSSIRPDIKEQILDRLVYLSGRYNSDLILDKISQIDIIESNIIFDQLFSGK